MKKIILIFLIATLFVCCTNEEIKSDEPILFKSKIAGISKLWKPVVSNNNNVLLDVYSDESVNRFTYHIYRIDLDCYVKTNFIKLENSKVEKHNKDTLLISYQFIETKKYYEFTYSEPNLILKTIENNIVLNTDEFSRVNTTVISNCSDD